MSTGAPLRFNSERDFALESINTWLRDLFDVTVCEVGFNPEADEFVTVKYEQNGSSLDVVSSGAGLQQVIQMLTYLYLGRPRVLLIDEPDAHLHSKLQARLGELFRRVAEDLDAQVFLSTHSLDLIDTFSTNEVLVVDATKRTIVPMGRNTDLVSALVDANVVEVSALSRLLSSRRLVVIEDSDQTILKAIDKAIGSPLFSAQSTAYVLPAKGIGNFRAIADLGRVLASLSGTKFEITFVQDRDGMPDFIVQPFLDSQANEGVGVQLLGRHEIESYLLEPALFQAAGDLIGRKVTPSEVEDAIVEAGKALKPRATRASLDTAKGINRHLAPSERFKESDLEEKVYAWFDQVDLTSFKAIRKVFPGKELLHDVLKLLNRDGGKKLTRGNLVASIRKDLVDTRIAKLLDNLAQGRPKSPPEADRKRKLR